MVELSHGCANFLSIGLLAGFNSYVAYGYNIPKIYGALAGFTVLMMWICAANLILLIGAETDAALSQLSSFGAGT